MEYPTGRFSAVAATTVALIVALVGASDAQRRGRGAEPNPYLPLATDTIHAQPERFRGQRVTISAGVERVVSKTVFIVDQRRIAADGRTKEAIGRPLLVIAPTLNGTLDKAHYMLFVGELIAFSPEAVAARATGYALDMPAELQARYAGAPALLATSVVDSHYVDQAKRLITEEERALSLVMRRIGPAFTAMQRALDGTNAAAQVLESAETLKQGLLDSEVFWRERPDAMTWAREAREHLDIVQKDTTGGNWESARQAAGRVQFACQRCHQQYREELDDGTFRIRATPTGGA